MMSENLNPEFFNADGTFKTFAERNAYRLEKEKAKKLGQMEAAIATRQNAKPTSGVEGRIAELKKQRKFATPVEKAGIDRRLAMLTEHHNRWEETQKVAAWEGEFDRSDLARYALDSIERIQRSGAALYPNATQAQLNELAALADARHQFPDPESFGREFFNRLAVIEDQEASAARKSAEDNRIESERLAAESAKANLRAAEANARKSQIPEVG